MFFVVDAVSTQLSKGFLRMVATVSENFYIFANDYHKDRGDKDNKDPKDLKDLKDLKDPKALIAPKALNKKTQHYEWQRQ